MARVLLDLNNPVFQSNQRIYSLRITQRVRAVTYRDGHFLRLLSLHSDHDSA
jgi:hypothetical protein